MYAAWAETLQYRRCLVLTGSKSSLSLSPPSLGLPGQAKNGNRPDFTYVVNSPILPRCPGSTRGSKSHRSMPYPFSAWNQPTGRRGRHQGQRARVGKCAVRECAMRECGVRECGVSPGIRFLLCEAASALRSRSCFGGVGSLRSTSRSSRGFMCAMVGDRRH